MSVTRPPDDATDRVASAPAGTSAAASRFLWAGLLLVLAVALGAGIRSALRRPGAPKPSEPVVGRGAGAVSPEVPTGSSGLPLGEELPDFSLTERSGRRVTRADLMGKVWIADFIFTRCPNVCPALSRRMAEVRSRLSASGLDDILSVSFTVDPVHDTPAVLSDYAATYHADRSWLFLGGDPSEVLRLVKGGFQLIMVDPSEGPPAHSNRFVLVDANGRTRSSHLGTDEGVVEAIVAEARALRKESLE